MDFTHEGQNFSLIIIFKYFVVTHIILPAIFLEEKTYNFIIILHLFHIPKPIYTK